MSEADRYIGLMSGTSLDGIDAAIVDFADGCRVESALTLPYSDDLSRRLAVAASAAHPSLDEVMRLDGAVADAFAAATRTVLQQAGATPGAIRAIGSHGHTLRHLVANGEVSTWQIGDPSRLAAATGLTVVADFRRRDTAEGGQGAPLVPAFHAALFRRTEEARVVLNLGGMANITVLPADPDLPVSGFDTGPGNILLNSWVARHRGEPLDRDGAWGAGGTVIPELLTAMLAEPFFAEPPPKSTGRETFNSDWLDRHRPERWPAVDVQATLMALTASTAAAAILHHAPDTERLLLCGGGVHNGALLGALGERLPGLSIDSTALHGLDPDWVEAAAFAWLARERLASRTANEPAVTGARRRVILGGVYAP